MAEHSEFGTILTLGLLGVGAYLVYEWYQSSQAAGAVTPTATPGTTTSMQQSGSPTSVSTAPSTTPPPPPISNAVQTLAGNMTSMLGQATGTADQWNYEFQKVMGQSISVMYNFNFDSVYGPIVAGVRNNGAQITAMLFLQLAAQQNGGTLPGLQGLGAISVLARGPALTTKNNMIFANHHPLPYAPTYTMFRGLGSYTQASGFERALFAGQPLIRYFA